MNRLLASTLVLIFIYTLFTSASFAAEKLNIGSPIPNISLPTITGEQFNLGQIRGKPAIITFFSSWSESCVNNLKFLNALADADPTVSVIAVSFDNKVSKVEELFDKHGLINFTGLIDKKKVYLDKFHILIIPMTFVIDKNGILRNMYVDFDDSVKNLVLADLDEMDRRK